MSVQLVPCSFVLTFVVSCDGSKERRFLFVVYMVAFQIWDCTDLESLQELLNVDGRRKSMEGGSISDPGRSVGPCLASCCDAGISKEGGKGFV